ncbi:MAG: sugar phosphate isomerase/epimerase [Candidatus Eremiobacteraeota bacterium]|nr:sugar phosphate isomerase/epimerase [Candidatus Eremiobacteraeota bacterium]
MNHVKIGIQTSRLPGETLNEQFSAAKRLGFDAVEVNVGPAFDLANRLDDVKRAVDASGLPVCAICTHSIHDPLQPDPAERQRRFAGLAQLLALADELGAAGVISVPVRRPVTFPDLADQDRDLRELAINEFRTWAAALPAGRSRVFLEPLNRYEATFLRRVEQAVDLAAAIDHPRVTALADLFHMNIEEASMSQPILDAGARLGHVHIADNNRLQPGAGCLDFQPPFDALKRIEYDGWISIECSALGGPLAERGPEAMLPDTAHFLRAQWDRA